MFMDGCVFVGVCVHGYTYVCSWVCVFICVCAHIHTRARARARTGVRSLSSSCGNQKTIPGISLPLSPVRQALFFTDVYPSLDFHLTHHPENLGMTDMHYCTQYDMGSEVRSHAFTSSLPTEPSPQPPSCF